MVLTKTPALVRVLGELRLTSLASSSEPDLLTVHELAVYRTLVPSPWGPVDVLSAPAGVVCLLSDTDEAWTVPVPAPQVVGVLYAHASDPVAFPMPDGWGPPR